MLKINGNFKLFKYENISIDDENEEFFSKLGDTIAELACAWKSEYPKLKSLKQSDLELVKTTSNGKYKNVYARIYTSKTGKVNCRLSQCKKVDGVFKRKRIGIDELIDESFKGSCVLRVY